MHTARLWASGFCNQLQIYCICMCISRTFLTRIYSPKLGCGLYTEYYVFFLEPDPPNKAIVLLTIEPAMPVLYVVKLPVETANVWDSYLASYYTCVNVSMYYWCIGIFWLYESSQHHQFPKVGRLWHYWQITVNAASDNQSAANAIANIVLTHR
jgi:hypothetical protein